MAFIHYHIREPLHVRQYQLDGNASSTAATVANDNSRRGAGTDALLDVAGWDQSNGDGCRTSLANGIIRATYNARRHCGEQRGGVDVYQGCASVSGALAIAIARENCLPSWLCQRRARLVQQWRRHNCFIAIACFVFLLICFFV